ncbi:hypothetical protein VTL71DRAFT_4560 [Oculimacula yallundae]|uniref:NAD(P)-binding protein n=1 Tax=Oculimacula yallundae TaxID=86028 RepID=A0ABR4C3X1_9HELO
MTFKPSSLPSLQGKTFLVTGGNTGIGYATTLTLASKGARVYIGARSLTKANEAISKIIAIHPEADLHTLILDHNSLSSVVSAAKTFASKEKKIHGLILNAGIMAVPYEITKDGFESQMQVNYLAHWLLTFHLLPTLLATAKEDGPGSVRIVCVSSEGHQKFSFGTKEILYKEDEIKAFGDFGRYGLSKLANVMHAKSLHMQFGPGSESARAGRGEIWTGSLHPGFIDTGMNEGTRDRQRWYLSWLHYVLRLFGVMRPWDEGCVSSVFVGASPDFRSELSGLYFNEFAKAKEPNVAAKDLVGQEKLELWTKEVMKEGGWI